MIDPDEVDPGRCLYGLDFGHAGTNRHHMRLMAERCAQSGRAEGRHHTCASQRQYPDCSAGDDRTLRGGFCVGAIECCTLTAGDDPQTGPGSDMLVAVDNLYNGSLVRKIEVGRIQVSSAVDVRACSVHESGSFRCVRGRPILAPGKVKN